jgi:hypothetical protein
MKIINNLLRRYLEKHGYFIEAPSLDQYHHILNRIPQAEFEDHLELRGIIHSDIVDEAMSIDEDIAQQLYDANAFNNVLQKEADVLKKLLNIEVKD